MHVDGWLKGARWVPSPNFNARPAGVEPSLIVIHSISLPPGEYDNSYIEQFFQNRLDVSVHPYFDEIANLQVSAHFLIKRDGELVQFVSCNDRAWHAGVSSYCGKEGCNDFSIGIELEGQDTEPYDSRQYSTLASLTKWLMDQYPLLSVEHVVGHCDIAPGRKTDPGEAFDWAVYRALIA